MNELAAAACVSAVLLGCAPIDVRSEVSVRPREGPPQYIGSEQLVARDFVADYVQLGPRLLVEVRELRACARARHVPVLRIEEVHRSTRGFVIWDFVLGGFTGGFAALAFARPQLFGNRLVDGMGREIIDNSGAYVVGGVFSAISAALLTAGIVDAIRSRDTTHYADAYEVSLGPEQPCGDGEAAALSQRDLRLSVGEGVIEVEATTDEQGRARFELPSWPGEIPASGRLPATIAVIGLARGDIEVRTLALWLQVPFAGSTEAHAGVADTRTPEPEPAPEPEPIEGPRAAPETP